MKEAFRKLHLSPANKLRLEQINNIIEEYLADGYRMTLRQLYYQFVSRDIIPNQDKEYVKLGQLLTEGRMAGIVDWDAIEDRNRRPQLPYWAESPADAINDILRQYRRNRQEDQDKYIEVWIEKDALSGVIRRTTEHFHVRLMINKGYSSCTAMHDAAKRIEQELEKPGVSEAYILYLGDHDPSGLDMVRDVEDRLSEFGVDVNVLPIALTDEQIEEYNPPPNPTKITDPRAAAYLEKYGETCWEVDALNPKVLNSVVNREIKKLIDLDLFDESIGKEAADIEKLTKLSKSRTMK